MVIRWGGIGSWMFELKVQKSPPSPDAKASCATSPMQVIGEEIELTVRATLLPIDLRWGGGRPQA